MLDLDGSTDGATALEPVSPGEELATGTLVGDYRIESRIGYGGMGIVYGAVHPQIGKRAAIKVLNARYCADRESLSRFVREAQAVNKIGHANIVDIFAIGELPDGRRYLVMEWLQGETLMDRFEREDIPRRETIQILITLTRALEAAHNAGVIHRDIKPENVFLVREDDGVRVKLLDFGIAKLDTTRRAPTNVTATGMTVGTPLYMSPEQAKGMAIDGRSDIYSLGVLAYGMLCGTTPFESEPSTVEILHAHISKPPRPPRELVPDLPPALDNVILQMLAKKPDERPPLVDIRRRIKALDATFETETPLPARSRAAHVPSRSRRPIALGVIALVLGAGGFFAWQSMTSEAEPARSSPPVAVEEQPAPPPPTPPTEVPAPGTIEIVVEPAHATVKVDGKAVPLVKGRGRIELAAGKYEITTAASGYRAREQTVAVASTRVTSVSIKLSKQQQRPLRNPPDPPKDIDAVVNPFKKKRAK